MNEGKLKKKAAGLPVGLLFVGMKPLQHFDSTSLAIGRSARLALFSFRAKNLSDRMDEAELVKSRLQDAFARLDHRKDSITAVVKHGGTLVTLFKKLNDEALNIGAISKEAFNILDAVNGETMERIAGFMPTTMNQAHKVFLSTLDSSKLNGAHGVIQLKQLCFEMESLTDFWRNKVVQKVDFTLDSIHQHNAEVIPSSTRHQLVRG
ncbi:MAG: hypothetical protein Q7K26_01540 [bacterium]|nr:hypothetical protein [bacterium]